MITVISGTNRPLSKTLAVALFCQQALSAAGEDVQLLDLMDINGHVLADDMYSTSGQHKAFADIQERYLIPSDHWVIVSPEYNGSFPGILKFFIDAVSVINYKKTYSGKKVSLIGLSSGRAGNFRGMEHLTGIFNYLSVLVMPNKLPISSADSFISKSGEINPSLQQTLLEFAEEILEFNKFGKVYHLND
jgi:NAD(P)H-dependent FMN reductase